jgi:ubiquinone/menaquinone biosynthesis C-methylase UbiE
MHDFLRNISDSYNRVATEYKAFINELDHKPLDREILSRFARMTIDQGKVYDLGCGPGHISAYLKKSGIDVNGVDISEGMIREAKITYKDIDFFVGNMFDLDVANDQLAGVVAFYSIVNIPQENLFEVFKEINRVIKPGGNFLISFHIGNEKKQLTRFLDQDVLMDFYFFEPDIILQILEKVGFVIDDVVIRYPYRGVEYQSKRAYILSTKNK